MSKKITRVRWSAQNLPYGLDISGTTGVITGTPEDVGEYTVPITVETNYGKDTKDVKIIVEPPTYGVYAIGSKAAAWADGGEPDEYGFYGLVMPKAYALVVQDNGFGALVAGGQYYCCGTYDIKQDIYGFGDLSTTIISNNSNPKNMTEYGVTGYSSMKRVIIGSVYYYKTTTGNYTVVTEERYYCMWILYQNTSGIYDDLGSIRFGAGIGKSKGGTTNLVYYPGGRRFEQSTLLNVSGGLWRGKGIEPGFLFTDRPFFNSLSFLCCDGTKRVNIVPTEATHKQETGNSTTGVPTATVLNLGYRAIKFLDAKFSYLSEDGYLDNNPDNFTHGIIKDVWAYGNAVYVQTTSNQLYEYVSSSATWDLLGTYDARKVEVPNAQNMLMLTNDGELYHKGVAITGLFDEAHDMLTRVFPALTFKDFTFGGNTLTVLRE